MIPERAILGTRVRGLEHHRIAERRDMVGTVVGRYGGADHVAVDVRFSEGRERLFWPKDLEEVASVRPPRWRSLFEKAGIR